MNVFKPLVLATACSLVLFGSSIAGAAGTQTQGGYTDQSGEVPGYDSEAEDTVTGMTGTESGPAAGTYRTMGDEASSTDAAAMEAMEESETETDDQTSQDAVPSELDESTTPAYEDEEPKMPTTEKDTEGQDAVPDEFDRSTTPAHEDEKPHSGT